MPTSVLFHDGKLLENSTPLVAVCDQALVMGQGVFETLIAHQGQVFAFDRHMDRLENSAGLMGIRLPDRESVAADIDRTLSESGFGDLDKARIRLTLTGGIGDKRFSDEESEPQFFIEISPAPSFGDFATLVTVPFVRNDRGALAGAKTINYGENAVALRLARETGADEAIFGNTRDLLCEGTWSNIFVFTKGNWITPPLTSGCLPGVTRALVLELGFKIEEGDLPMEDLTSIEGGFLTSTLRGLQAIGSIDGRTMPWQEAPGFHEMRQAYQDLAGPNG